MFNKLSNKVKFSSDLKIKLLSLLAAFAMWVFVMEEIDPITVRSLKNVEISEITNIQEIENNGLIISNNQDLVTNIDFRGKRSVLADFIKLAPVVTAKIENPKIGTNDMILSINSPTNIEYSFDPSVIKVELEESITEIREVRYETIGELTQGYEIKNISLSDDEISIQGARSQVNKVKNLVAKIDISDVKNDYSLRLKAIPVDEKGNEIFGIKVNKDYIMADINVLAYKEVPIKFDVLDYSNNKIDNYLYKSERETVKIYGKPEDIEKIESIYTEDIHLEMLNSLNGTNLVVKLQKISNIETEFNEINLIPNVENVSSFVLEIPRKDVVFSDDLNKEDILNKLPEIIEVNFSTSNEYKNIISKDILEIGIDNIDIKEEYELYFKFNIPIISYDSNISVVKF